MEEYVVYILWSEKYSKIYIGFTGHLISRFASHNHLSKKGWTMRYRPWQVAYVHFFSSKSLAMKHEKYLKTGVGREWISENVTFI